MWSAVLQRLQLLGMPAAGTNILAGGGGDAGGEGGEGGGGATAATAATAAVPGGATTGVATRVLSRANSTLSGLAHQV